MANITVNTEHTISLGRVFSAPFRAIGRFLVAIMENNTRVKQLEYLSSLSDEQLAAKGLKREEIVHHVFKGQYYV